jgi:hypothetical protein
MSIGRDLKRKEGGKHKKDYVGFAGYGYVVWMCPFYKDYRIHSTISDRRNISQSLWI